MEVLIAVALMASATTIIIGLQSSSVYRTLRDRNGQQAALAARRILSLVEAQDSDLDSNQYSGSAYDVLSQLGVASTQTELSKDLLSKYQVQLSMEPWDVLGPDSLKKIMLTIAWGADPDDHIDYVYFVAK